MANQIQYAPGDLSRSDLLKILKDEGLRGWSDSNLNEKLERFCEAYDISYEALINNKESQKPKIHIRKEWKELFLLMILTFEQDPFLMAEFDLPQRASAMDIIKYYCTIMERVDNYFPSQLRYSIITSTPYISMVMEYSAMTKLVDKLSELSAAMALINSGTRTQFWLELYDLLDRMIFRAYQIDKERKQESQDQINMNLDDCVHGIYTLKSELFNPESKISQEEKVRMIDSSFIFNMMLIKNGAVAREKEYSKLPNCQRRFDFA